MACFPIEQYTVQPINRKKLIGPNSQLLKLNLQNQLTREIIPIATSKESA